MKFKKQKVKDLDSTIPIFYKIYVIGFDTAIAGGTKQSYEDFERAFKGKISEKKV